MQATVAVVEGTARAAALLDPVRLRILERLRTPSSAAAVARELGLPRQRVGYHVKELEKSGLLQQVGERRKGNCVERLVQATAQHYLIAPQALGALGADPDQVRDRFSSSYLVAVAARTIREVATLRERAREAEQALPTFTLQTDVRFATAADRNAFAEELSNAVARLCARYHDETSDGGRVYRFVVSGYPAPPAAGTTAPAPESGPTRAADPTGGDGPSQTPDRRRPR